MTICMGERNGTVVSKQGLKYLTALAAFRVGPNYAVAAVGGGLGVVELLLHTGTAL